MKSVATQAFTRRFQQKTEMVMLKEEVQELKIANAQFAPSMEKSSAKFEDTSNQLENTTLDIQSKLEKFVGEEVADNKLKGEKETHVLEKKKKTEKENSRTKHNKSQVIVAK